MLLTIALFLLLSSIGDDIAYAEESQREREERRYKEITAVKKPTHKITRRRIIKDKEGNVIAEEITEEICDE